MNSFIPKWLPLNNDLSHALNNSISKIYNTCVILNDSTIICMQSRATYLIVNYAIYLIYIQMTQQEKIYSILFKSKNLSL